MWKSEKREKTINTKLYVRILPSMDFDYDSIKTEINKKVLYVRCLQDLSKGVKVKNPNFWYFCTDGIFWNSCQSEVYKTVAADLYEQLFDGVRAMILCYGQTGTGKTFTASGLRFSFKHRGLILRILSQLFEEEETRRDVSRIRIGMSYLEFRGQTVKDLISNKVLNNDREVAEYPIPDEAWAYRQLFKAEAKKSFSDSAPYRGANKGHSVLTFHIHSESLIDTDPVIRHSKIHIVDMGGIDNLGNKPSAWKNKLDLGSSNVTKSLMEQFILCLSKTSLENENRRCPFKSSKFLMYLHDTLKQSCMLRFIAHIYGNFENLPLTISTLRFGERIRAMKPTRLERVFESNQEFLCRNLEKEYLFLKDEMELMGMLRDAPDYSIISQERLQEIRRAAEAFLFNQLEDLTLFSLTQASLTLKVFRDLYQRLSAEKEQVMKNAMAAAAEMMHSQLMLDRSQASNVNASSTQKVSRRRSRQVESQSSFLGISHRSTDSAQNIGKALSGVQQQGGQNIGTTLSSAQQQGGQSAGKALVGVHQQGGQSIGTALSTAQQQGGQSTGKILSSAQQQGGQSIGKILSSAQQQGGQNIATGLVGVHQVGVTDRKGISIGPGKPCSAFEGNFTKAFKKLRSKKSDSVIFKGTKSATTKEFGIHSSKNQRALDEISELSIGQAIPSRDSAWKNFVNEKTELAAELTNKVENAEEKAKEFKRKYTRSLEELSKVREEIEDHKLELENSQHVRQIYGKGESNEEENLRSEEFEKELTGVIAQKQDLVNEAVEKCHVALIDFRNAAEEMNEAKKALEEVFQSFCKENYKTVFAPDEMAPCDMKSEEGEEEATSESDLKNQARMELYTLLQEKFLNDVPKSSRNRRKEWVALF